MRRPAAACLGLAVTLVLASVALAAAGSTSQGGFVWHALPGTKGPQARAARAIAKPTWLTGVRVTEYYPAPEQWALGRPARTPGLRAEHRSDWPDGGVGPADGGT